MAEINEHVIINGKQYPYNINGGGNAENDIRKNYEIKIDSEIKARYPKDLAEMNDHVIINGKQYPNNVNGGNVEDGIHKFNEIKDDHEIIARYTKDNTSPPVERVKFEGLGSDIDSMSSEDSLSVLQKLPPVPDGGWGWVVVLAAFLVAACADGLSFSYGLLQEEFARYFDTKQSQVSLIGSLFIATPLLAGPVMSALVDRYGCRVMTMIAGVLSAISFLLASLCDSIEMLCLTFGFMSGLAMGILYVTSVVSVAFWFDKKRNLAVSLASSGIGFGTLIYSPLTHYFLQVYDWRNTIVLLAGTLLNMCVCGALMRTPEWLEIKQKRERSLTRSRRTSSQGSISSRSIGGESLYLSTEELQSLLKSGKSPEYILEMLTTNIAEAEQLETATQMNAEQTSKRIHSAIQLPTFIQRNEKVPPEVIEKIMRNHRLYNIILENYPDVLTRRRSEVNFNVEAPPTNALPELAVVPVQIKFKKPKESTETMEKIDNTAKEADNTNKTAKEQNKSSANEELINSATKLNRRTSKDAKQAQPQPSNWLARQISTDHHYFKNMPLYRNSMMYRGTMMSIPRYRLKASSLPDIYRNSMWSLESESDDEWGWHHRLWEVCKKSFNFEMFTEFHFFIFNLSELILSVWFIVPYFFLKSYMSAEDMEGGEVMISIIGIASAIGIVALGWSGDQPWVCVDKVFAACLIICGLSVAAYPFFIRNYWALSVNSAVFGFSFASSYSYAPAILMKLIPIEQFTVAYGLILLVQGIGHLAGPPLGGLLYDITGSWELTFYVGGLWVVMSGMCLVVIACTDNRRMCGQAPLLIQQKRKDEDSEKSSDV